MRDFEKFKAAGKTRLPGYLGIEIVRIDDKSGLARMEVVEHLMASNGYLHGGSIVALADTIAGYSCFYNLPPDAKNFTTMELKTNFLGTAREGFVKAEASLVHSGRSTQIWDVVVKNETTEKKIAIFRCTQMIMY